MITMKKHVTVPVQFMFVLIQASLILRDRNLADSVLVCLSLYWNSLDTINTSFSQIAKWMHNCRKFPSIPKSSACLNISDHQNEKKNTHHQTFTSGYDIVYTTNTCLVTAKMLCYQPKMFFFQVLSLSWPHYLSLWSTTGVHHATQNTCRMNILYLFSFSWLLLLSMLSQYCVIMW